MLQMKIIKFSELYSREVITLITGIQKNEFDIQITLKDQPDLENIPDFYQKANGNFWVAIVDNSVVGTIALLDIGNGAAALRKMFVHRDFRGSKYGIAPALLCALLKWAAEKNLVQIFLGTTEKFLAAHRFYEKNGFKEINKALLPPAFPVMAVDVKFYQYQLGSRPGLNKNKRLRF